MVVVVPLPTKQRPINLLPMLYRVWSSARCRQLVRQLSQVAPDCLQGFLRGRSCRRLWLKLAWHLEDCIVNNRTLSGLVLDVVKAFNALPRAPFFQILKDMSIPEGLLRAWEASLTGLQRCFRIQGGLQNFFHTYNGFPEGDSLSVVPMILCGWLWAAHVQGASVMEAEYQYQPSDVQPMVFADNFEVLTGVPDPAILQTLLMRSEGFASLLQIQLAPKKMFVWSTSPALRKGLRVQSSDGEVLECKLHARELGAYLNFSRMKCNRSGAARVTEVQGELFRLAFAPIRKPVKAAIVRGKYWPKALHACEAATVSATTVKDLRRSAARAILGATREFACNALTLNILNPDTDPKGFLFWRRILALREYIAWYPQELERVQSLLVDRRQTASGVGPAKLFNEVCDFLGWEIRFQGSWLTSRRVGSFHFLNVCIVRLRGIFQEDFADIWSCDAGGRKYMRDLQDPETCIDVQATLALRNSLDPRDQGLLDSVLVGAARWQLRQQGRREKQDTDEARLCECGALPSGLEHRWLECPLFQEVRDAHPDAVSLLRTLPLITQRYGLFIQGVEEKILRATADMRPLPSRQDLGILAHEAVAFVDGSAHLPQERRFRQAGYAVVVRNQLVSDDALTISGKPSGAQTVPRAELSAGLQGVRSGKNATVYSDCQHFVDSWDQFRELPYELMPNGDLWKLLDEEASRARAEGRTIRVFKVKAHQVLAKIADPHARLLAEGNDAVDKAAKAAAPLCTEWTRLRAEHRRRCAQARCIHKFFVAVQSCAMDKLQEVAPRKSTGVLAPVQQECCLPS